MSALLLVVVYYFAFRAGCVFHDQHESAIISEPYSMFSLLAVLASFISAILSIYIFTRHHVKATLAVFLLILSIGVPFTLWLSMTAAGNGAQTCRASYPVSQ